MRRIIFIGQSGNQTVYLDTRTNEALIAGKSVFLDTEGARKSNSCLLPMLSFLSLLAGGGSLMIYDHLHPFRLEPWMLWIFVPATCLVFLGSLVLFEMTLYKEVKDTQLATRAEFDEAVETNLFWDNFSDKEATYGKIIFFLGVIAILLFCLVILVLFAFPGMILAYFDQEDFKLSTLLSPVAGLFPSLVFLLLFQNNPIRWLLAVRKYQDGRLVFKED